MLLRYCVRLKFSLQIAVTWLHIITFKQIRADGYYTITTETGTCMFYNIDNIFDIFS